MIWVRTQDKKALVQIANFYITEDTTSRFMGVTTYGEYIVLGRYTKRKASKVLSMIQDFIVTKEMLKHFNPQHARLNTDNFIFEMPQKEEVVV